MYNLHHIDVLFFKKYNLCIKYKYSSYKMSFYYCYISKNYLIN